MSGATTPSGGSGLFVTFEGLDGVGKSTQARRAAEALQAAGERVVLTREPGGSPGAEEIRALLVNGAPERWSAETELLLFNAARRDHVDRLIRPALDEGAIVLCDRFVDSTRAYQSAGRGADPALVEALHSVAIGLEADLTLIYDLDPAAAKARAEQAEAASRATVDEATRPTRFERFDAGFHARLRAAFQQIAEDHPARCRLIDAAAPAEALLETTLDAIRAEIGRARAARLAP